MKTMAFYHYLIMEGQMESTAQEHLQNLALLIKWTEESKQGSIDQLGYTQLLDYVQHLKDKKIAVSTINIRLGSIRKYYDHLKAEGVIEKNPAKRLHIKGNLKRVVENVMGYDELEKLYEDYSRFIAAKENVQVLHQQRQLRSKVMLSLMIFQGLHAGELLKMEKENLQPEKGIVYVPATARSNERELKLKAEQIIPAHQYLKTLPEDQQQLFTGNVHNQVQWLLKEVQGINPVVRDAQHIRASVVLHWLKMYDKRQVQYMIGHKHISSTERYEAQQIDELTDQLEKYHPFNL